LSKEIRKHLRKQLRAKRNKRVTQILDIFCTLNRLDSAFRDPIWSQKQIQKEPQPEEFASYLGDVFRYDVGHNASVLDMLNVFASSRGFHSIPPFQLPELEYVLSQMPCNKATDATGVVVEMFKYGNIKLRTCLLNIFNDMLKSGSWRATFFTMLPKMGDTSRPSCWRPIAILKMSYKIFSKLICQRLRATLDSHQSIDQTGFRPGTGIEGAKTILRIIMETLSESKWSIATGTRVFHSEKCETRRCHKPYSFQRCFGVGNAEMETQTVGESWFGHCREKITNIRYADDLMLYTRSLQDLRDMTELLITELGAVGLQLNASKTKILTTFSTFSGSRPMHVELAGDSVEIVSGRSKHKHLGKTLVGDLRHRAEVELGHRLQVAWAKFHKHSQQTCRIEIASHFF